MIIKILSVALVSALGGVAMLYQQTQSLARELEATCESLQEVQETAAANARACVDLASAKDQTIKDLSFLLEQKPRVIFKTKEIKRDCVVKSIDANSTHAFSFL